MRECCSRLETVGWRETPKSGPLFYADVGLNVLDWLPFTVRKYRSRALSRRLGELLTSGGYDLFVCDFLQPSINCLALPFRPKLLFQHNVETTIRRQLATYAPNPLARAYLRQDAVKLQSFERRAAQAFDHCIMVSAEDCGTMARLHGVMHTSAIPTGVDLEFFGPAPETGVEPSIAFLGSMDMLANQDAVLFFVREVLPLIRRTIPAALTVIGRNPPPAIARLTERLPITVTGTVGDVRPLVASAQVLVVPLRIAGGTRLKIFEAMAMGKAVVSTTRGAEGLPVRDGVDIVLADGAPAFADAVVRLLRSPDERRRIGDAGRRLVANNHGWDTAAGRFAEICAEVVARHGARAR